MEIYIYSDASFSQNSGIAIIGYMVFLGKNHLDKTTVSPPEVHCSKIQEVNNIRAEVRSVIAALRACKLTLGEEANPLDFKITVFTDCQTVSELLRRRKGLEEKQYISKSKNQELANKDLYIEFYNIYDLLKPNIIWLKGHTKTSLASPEDKMFSVLDKAVRHKLRDCTQ